MTCLAKIEKMIDSFPPSMNNIESIILFLCTNIESIVQYFPIQLHVPGYSLVWLQAPQLYRTAITGSTPCDE